MFCAVLIEATVIQARAAVQALASARLVRAASSSEMDWRSVSTRHRRQRVVREADGRLTMLRIIDHE